MYLTRKEIRTHIEAIAGQMYDLTPDYCNCEYSECIHDYIAELYTLAEDIYPFTVDENDPEAVREAVRETQYGSGI